MKILKALIDFVMDILETIIFVGSLLIVVYMFIAQPNQVKGASMQPSFYDGDYIITSKITYKFRHPQRGDVIVLKSPKNPDIDYIKRIIGLPGDKILVESTNVYINGQIIKESYISAPTNLWETGFLKEGVPFVVPRGYVFVMGDNRPRSSDSREFGPIPIESVIGVVKYRYYPPKKTGWIRNPLPNNFRTLLPVLPEYLLLLA